MASSDQNAPDGFRIPDDAAHRLLARAIELDDLSSIETSVENLRGDRERVRPGVGGVPGICTPHAARGPHRPRDRPCGRR